MGFFHLNTAVTLPIGVEAYAAYALRAWLTASGTVSIRTRRFARWSAVGSLLLGMAGQIAYHLLAQAHATHAPWGITTAVSCPPVLVLDMGAALAHLLHHDLQCLRVAGLAHSSSSCGPADQADCSAPHDDQAVVTFRRDQLAQAEASASRLISAGRPVSRRTLRADGLRGSNADLGALARVLRSEPTARRTMPQRVAGD